MVGISWLFMVRFSCAWYSAGSGVKSPVVDRIEIRLELVFCCVVICVGGESVHVVGVGV